MRLALILALGATMAFAQGGKLALNNVRSTFGLLGPVRTADGVLPGDSLWLEFDIDGITVSPDGKVKYSISLEAADAKGKVIYRQNPTDLEAVASLGGSSVVGQAHLDIGLEQPAGDYTAKVTVTDRASKQQQSFTQKVKVLPPAFGIVQVKTTSDPEGTVAAGMLSTGQSVFVNFAVVRFEREKAKQQPNVQFEMRILDEAGKSTLAKPDTGSIDSGVAAGDKLLGGQFYVSVNRPGKFVVELKAMDKIAGTSSSSSFPLTVQPRR